jgi:DNA-binding XRE family transcriptional regulator
MKRTSKSSVRKSWSNLKAKMPPASRARVAEKVASYRAVLALNELRKSRGLTQMELAEALNISQSAIAQQESAPNMEVATLRKHIAAMGGTMHLVADFPDGTSVDIAI